MTSATNITAGGLSLRYRLPLLTGGLLLLTVTSLGLLAYIGVRNAVMTIGKERLGSLTIQLGALLQQGAVAVTAETKRTAGKDPIVHFMGADGKTNAAFRDSALLALDKLRTDSTWIQAELISNNLEVVLRSSTPGRSISINTDSLLLRVGKKDSSFAGPLFRRQDSVFYPIVVTVMNNREVAGYLVRWKWQTTTAKVLQQFSNLLGTNAHVYFGNQDGSIWTDLFHVAEAPPTGFDSTQPFQEYNRPGQEPVIASMLPVPGTCWVVLTEFSRDIVLAGANQFIKWILLIGFIVVLAGLFAAWFVSRRITRPLENLTTAAEAIAGGDYSAMVDVTRRDELGKLGNAFNKMASQLVFAREGLEEKVSQRTEQLETVNKELEAFSYSVSHDLRAPLRHIGSYAGILHEEYATKMDEEAIRLTGKIVSNSKKMGLLIDDLIAFSQVSRADTNIETVDMQVLVASVVEELLPAVSHYEVITGTLPSCSGDGALLRQVWVNLIGNAIKYSSKIPLPRIEIGCETNGNRYTYFVRDNGAGFDMKYAQKLFGVFERLHSPREFEGTGIGLALAKRIIDRHHGKIYAEGKPGEGASFYFELLK